MAIATTSLTHCSILSILPLLRWTCPGQSGSPRRPAVEHRRAAQLMWTSAPPSTGNATPVMKFASSDARNSAAFATSQGVPILWRSGTRASRAAATSARLLPVTRARVSTAIGVSINPGRMAAQVDGSNAVESILGDLVKRRVPTSDATIHLTGGHRFHLPPLHKRQPIREAPVWRWGLPSFRQVADILPLAPGDNLSSACDDAPLRKRGDAQCA